ncbi:MAG: polyphosphate kinase 1, partial [Bacteroidales bacterium]|nr:polyphosphate kinase 1 [Bacteroidales bacterium]
MSNYIPKEISWLSFNERVLQEAENKNVPLHERFKFMGIYSNNLDDYFRVRVATLKRLTALGPKAKTMLGYNPATTLKKVQEIVLEQNVKFEKNYSNLLKELGKYNIFIINEKELDEKQTAFVSEYFHKKVRSRLMPLILDKNTPMPNLTDAAIYFAICLKNNKTGRKHYSLLEIPSNVLPRFIRLPDRDDKKYIMFLDDVIRLRLKDIFFIFDFDEISAYTIKLTKDAEIDIADAVTETYLEKLERGLRKRQNGSAVRFIYDRNMPSDLLKLITKKLNFGKEDVVVPSNRYHNFKDFMNFPKIGPDETFNEPIPSVPHKDIPIGKSILAAIKKKDILLFFPYNPFDHFIELLREASIDPLVKSIDITLYRVAANSNVINALLNAVRNGKKVTTVVELRARFDEEANILWGDKLMDAGVKVIYGVPGLKVHAKLCLITRERNNVVERFAAVGTGNFNEDTAKIYTDHMLLTSDKKITNEVYKSFNFFNMNYRKDNFYHLVLSPYFLRNRINFLIDNEIKNAKMGKKAYIYMKMNNMTDQEIVQNLYEASSAGVK